MGNTKTITRSAAAAAIASLALASCSTSAEEPSESASASACTAVDLSGDNTVAWGDTVEEGLIVGSLLPLTGSLAFLGPPEVAGVDLALAEINAAGGVLGQDLTVIHKDSSDTENPQIAKQSVADPTSDGASAIVGAASSSVSLSVVDDIAAAGIVQISPANTATALSGYSEFYFRVAPPDTVQGSALANLISSDGNESLGILVFNDDYGISLRDVVVSTFEGSGGTVTYGTVGQEFDPAASNFAADVQNVVATEPDAIAVIAFDQTKQIVPELVAAGYDASKLYFVDGNTASYEADFEAGTLTGSKGTIPGANASDDFKACMGEAYGEELTEFAYGAESYDATILVALAAVRGGATDGATIRDNLAAVSGANGGTECSAYAECAQLLVDGEEIAFKTVGGSGAFNADNDPSSAFIGVYEFDENNNPVWVDAVFGEV